MKSWISMVLINVMIAGRSEEPLTLPRHNNGSRYACHLRGVIR